MSDPIPTPDHELPALTLPTPDRRRHKRFKVERPGKVFRRSTQQYVAASSRDLSFTGALLELDAQRPMAVGEIIDIGLALNTSAAVVSSENLLRGIVVRSRALEAGKQLVAVRYLHREGMSVAA